MLKSNDKEYKFDWLNRNYIGGISNILPVNACMSITEIHDKVIFHFVRKDFLKKYDFFPFTYIKQRLQVTFSNVDFTCIVLC